MKAQTNKTDPKEEIEFSLGAEYNQYINSPLNYAKFVV